MTTHDEYRALDAVNFSTLKLMRDSPAHYREAVRAGRAGEGDTASRGMLRAVHCLVLEPHAFDEQFAVWDGGRRGTRAHKAWVADLNGRTGITESEMDNARTIAAAVRANPDAAALLRPTDGWSIATEQPMVWIDEATGLRCKGRADLVRVCRKGAEVWDLKTVQSNAPRLLSATCARMAYHIQAAHYAAGVSAMLRRIGHPAAEIPVRAGLITVEGRAPHDVAVWEFSQDSLDAGHGQRNTLLERVAECRASGEWPGRHSGLQTIHLPLWAYEDTDDDAGFWE